MSCKSLKKPKLSDIGNDMISIYVGDRPKRQVFTIHKKLLQKTSKYFDKMLESESGQKGLIFLNSEDPEVFRWFNDWVYKGTIPKAPCSLSVKEMPSSETEKNKLENGLRQRFDKHVKKLVDLYIFAEELDNENMQNKTIDTIQDSFHEYGTVFGPGLLEAIFSTTKFNCRLRDLAVAANVMHTDRGCNQLRQELMCISFMCPEFLPYMLKWIARNFTMFGRRATEGFDVRKPNEGFSILNRAKLCPCHFHKHTNGGAHKDHTKCAIPYMKCGHGDDDEDESMGRFNIADLFGLSLSVDERTIQ